MIVPFALRGLLESLLKSTGARLEQRTTPEILGFDTTSMPVDLDLPSRVRDPKSVTLITVHVTDVSGGFGVAKSAVARWRKLLEQGKVPRELAAQLRDPTDLGGSSFLLALLERYSRCAYHSIGSRRAGSIRNHPLSLRTSHGNGGNRGAGWALDAGHKEALTPELVSVGRESLRDLCFEVLDEGGGEVVIAPHRAFDRGRVADTSAGPWGQVVRATVDELAAEGRPVRIDYELAEKSGRPVPRSWDDRALFDDKGRRLAA
jgi:hypothetical protein